MGKNRNEIFTRDNRRFNLFDCKWLSLIIIDCRFILFLFSLLVLRHI